jgi:hypothetical protein
MITDFSGNQTSAGFAGSCAILSGIGKAADQAWTRY